MTIPAEYRSVRSLGLGATSEVFEAVNLDTQETIALKVFSPLILSDADAVQRLRGEVEALEKLRHANIVALKNICARPDFFALELELVRGTDLRQWANGYDSALHEPKLWILAQVARGLGAAHENGVLHRDLKPENVLVSETGDVKLTDFGLSRSISRLTLTRMGLLVGSLGYMAPECVNGLRATEQSDLFSFGVIAYELLAGRAPFEADTPQALIKKITDGSFESLRTACPSLPASVAEAIDGCLAIDPSLRPESSWSVEAALMNCLLASGLVSHCRALVGVTTREAALTGALSAKHVKLSGRVQEIMNQARADGAETRRKLLPAVNELKRVFPEDPLIGRALALMTSGGVVAQSASCRRAVVAVVLVFLVLGFFGLRATVFASKHPSPKALAGLQTSSASPQALVNGATQASVSGMPQASVNGATQVAASGGVAMQTSAGAPDTSVPSNAPSVPYEIPPKPAKIRRAALREKVDTELAADLNSPTATTKATIPTGNIVFEADTDVDVYVDGKLVSPNAWAMYEAPVGERKIRLVKAGFDPIDNIVNVKAGQKTVVKAKQ